MGYKFLQRLLLANITKSSPTPRNMLIKMEIEWIIKTTRVNAINYEGTL